MSTLAGLIAEGAAALAAAGVERPRAEARLLLRHASGLTDAQLFADPAAQIAGDALVRYRDWLGRRCAREPFAYILGWVEFLSLPFAVGSGVLIPRPDTETVVEAVRRRLPDDRARLRLLDIGVGSGCLLLTLLRIYPAATGLGTDTSDEALACALGNAEALGVDGRAGFRRTSWSRGIEGPFDVLVSNPPYIRRGDIRSLQPEVSRYEPEAALDGGEDGLDAYRAILPEIPRLLAPGGAAFLEIGAGQGGDVLNLADGWLGAHRLHRDLAGIVRCVELAPRAG